MENSDRVKIIENLQGRPYNVSIGFTLRGTTQYGAQELDNMIRQGIVKKKIIGKCPWYQLSAYYQR